MDSILNDDIIRYIFQYIGKYELMIISETCKTFNNLLENKKFPSDFYLFSNVKLIEWAIDHEYKIKKINMFKNAIKYGNVKVLQYLKDNIDNNSKFLQNDLFLIAVQKKSIEIEILEWLVKSQCIYNDSLFSIWSQPHIYHWISINCIWNFNQLYDIIKSKNINTLKWAIASIPRLSKFVCDIASECNSIKILKWGVNNKFKYGKKTCSNAAMNGNLKMLKFLRKNNCIWDSWTITDAVTNGHIHIIKWCLKNNCKVDDYAYYEAVSNNNLEILKILIKENKHKCCIDQKTYIEAKKYPEILKYLEENIKEYEMKNEEKEIYDCPVCLEDNL